MKMISPSREAPDKQRLFPCIPQSGFTLVEIMIVVGVIAILSAIATPFIMNWLPNMRLQSAARHLLTDMQNAKNEAIKTNTNVTLVFTPPAACPGGSYAFTDGNGLVVTTVTIADQDRDLCLRNPPVLPLVPIANAFPAGEGFTSRGLPIVGGINHSVVLTHARSTSLFTVTETIAGGITLQRLQ